MTNEREHRRALSQQDIDRLDRTDALLESIEMAYTAPETYDAPAVLARSVLYLAVVLEDLCRASKP